MKAASRRERSIRVWVSMTARARSVAACTMNWLTLTPTKAAASSNSSTTGCGTRAVIRPRSIVVFVAMRVGCFA